MNKLTKFTAEALAALTILSLAGCRSSDGTAQGESRPAQEQPARMIVKAYSGGKLTYVGLTNKVPASYDNNETYVHDDCLPKQTLLPSRHNAVVKGEMTILPARPDQTCDNLPKLEVQ